MSEQVPQYSSDAVNGHPPFVPGRRYVPAYYRPHRPNPRIDPLADVIDVGDAFALRPLLAVALKYIVRAGRKPGESRLKDLDKALEVIQRERDFAAVGPEIVVERTAWDDVSGHEVSR